MVCALVWVHWWVWFLGFGVLCVLGVLSVSFVFGFSSLCSWVCVFLWFGVLLCSLLCVLCGLVAILQRSLVFSLDFDIGVLFGGVG